MSLAEPPGHLGGLDLADRCNTPVLADLLEERDLLGHGQLLDGTLTERDTDRVRIAKFIAAHPEGTPLTHIVSYVVKGVSPNACERVEGSDADYQFAYRFVNDLAEREQPYVEKFDSSGVLMVSPTLRLLDLITEGITQTAHERDLKHDREFIRDYLARVDSVDEQLQEMLVDDFTSYLNRIEDYRLLFDVHFVGQTGGKTKRQMTKRYKTRFNDSGRISKQFARFNDALEYGYEHADNAVLCTLTTDPKRQDSLLDAIDSINDNFNRLLSYFDSDPSTKSDTRNPNVLGWRPDLDDSVTGRPRERPEYIKALEFTEKGYPHLHVLFFDVPTRERDDMPWLIDKPELAAKWADYGQGEIVDMYPLTYRDDLDDLEPEFQSDQGFVDWYRFGDHDHGEDWVRQRTRSHELIEFGDEGHEKESTAGAYLGKYLSATFGSLLEAGESFEKSDDERETYADKAATWKLALYWATNRRFWSASKAITEGIDPNEHTQDPDVREAVRWCSLDSVQSACESEIRDGLARRQWDDLDNLDASIERALSAAEHPQVRSTLPEEAAFRCVVDYIGAYASWDLPSQYQQNRDLEMVEEYVREDSGSRAKVG
ncbi:hypothetical protein [Halapricum desulfuricans]|uniref:Rolling circle replication protein Rep n=1 Tax=Halapricum desulfuricans TaxID=2841257 RepID=A0A897MVE5_9EURY|nr:hypothetical protein [Halapricum desulfuricans]QSG06080.1 Rolling circle replication protein Rep [Halapricum desulfuricans]